MKTYGQTMPRPQYITIRCQKCVFLKTLLFLIRSVNIKNLTSIYVVPEYRVQFGVNFNNFGSTVFAEERLMFPKICIHFSIYSKGGANFKKMEMVRCFIFDLKFFLKFLCISTEKNWDK